MTFSLSTIAIVITAVFAVVYGTLLFRPGLFAEAARAFVRNRKAALVVTAVDIIWVGYLIRSSALGWFEFLKPVSWLGALIAFILIAYYLDDLLGPRALGGLLLLIPAPVLDIARWHDSAWRLVITALMYILAVKGIILVLSPYRYRQWVEYLLARPALMRAGGITGLALCVLLFTLAVTVY